VWPGGCAGDTYVKLSSPITPGSHTVVGFDGTVVGLNLVPAQVCMLARSARNALGKLQLKSQASIRAVTKSVRTQQCGPRLYASLATLPTSKDDLALVDLFDQPSASLRSSALSPTGLFGHDSITEPHALVRLARATLARAQLLTERVLRARQSRDELKKVIKNLDRLSDMLCGVIDLAELVRNAHPEPEWVHAANWAYEALCEFMNVANTHVGLYEVCTSQFPWFRWFC
jgi:intermediate peptidase